MYMIGWNRKCVRFYNRTQSKSKPSKLLESLPDDVSAWKKSQVPHAHLKFPGGRVWMTKKKKIKKDKIWHNTRWGASHSKQLKASRSGESAHPSSAQWHTEITNVNAVTKEGFGNEVNTLDKRYVIPALISLAKVGRPMLYVKHHRRK